MIEVGVVDLSADGRRKLGALLERWSWVSPETNGLHLPRLSLRLLSPEEVRFHGGLDLCVVGPELVSCDVAQVAAIRRQLPDSPLLCVLDSKSYSFGMVEQLSRVQVDDVLTDTASSDEFFRRVILLARRAGSRVKGSLTVVDSARGGVGVTLVSAALAETIVDTGKKVCLVDTDTFSQDAARFLQCRPFVNEPLKLILDNQRVPTPETVRECAFKVWDDSDTFFCVSPPAACDQMVFASILGVRAFTGVLECLQLSYSSVIVDASSLPATARQALYQIADSVVFVANRDPAGAYANRQALSLVHGYARRDARIAVVVNDTTRSGLPVSALEEEILPARDRAIEVFEIPFSQRAARWPCSGATAAPALRRSLKGITTFLNACSTQQELPATSEKEPARISLLSRLRRVIAIPLAKRQREQMKDISAAELVTASAIERPFNPQRELAITAEAVSEDVLVSSPVLRKPGETARSGDTAQRFLNFL